VPATTAAFFYQSNIDTVKLFRQFHSTFNVSTLTQGSFFFKLA